MRLALENDFLSHGAFRGGHYQFVHPNLLFIKHLKHLRAYQPGGSYHCDFHLSILCCSRCKNRKKSIFFLDFYIFSYFCVNLTIKTEDLTKRKLFNHIITNQIVSL